MCVILTTICDCMQLAVQSTCGTVQALNKSVQTQTYACKAQLFFIFHAVTSCLLASFWKGGLAFLISENGPRGGFVCCHWQLRDSGCHIWWHPQLYCQYRRWSRRAYGVICHIQSEFRLITCLWKLTPSLTNSTAHTLSWEQVSFSL